MKTQDNQYNNMNFISQDMIISDIKKEENIIPNQTPLKTLNNSNSNNINAFIVKSNSKISNFLNRPENSHNNTSDILVDKSELNIFNILHKENTTYLEPEIDIIKKYQQKLNPSNITPNISKFYSKKGEEINNLSEYYEDMRNYFNDISKKQKNKLLSKNLSNINNTTNLTTTNNNNQITLPLNSNQNSNLTNNRKIIFIHDSAMQIRSI